MNTALEGSDQIVSDIFATGRREFREQNMELKRNSCKLSPVLVTLS